MELRMHVENRDLKIHHLKDERDLMRKKMESTQVRADEYLEVLQQTAQFQQQQSLLLSR